MPFRLENDFSLKDDLQCLRNDLVYLNRGGDQTHIATRNIILTFLMGGWALRKPA